jgi:hypothetical protein
MLHLGRLRPHPQTLDYAGKACQGQTLWLIMKRRKKLHNIGHGSYLEMSNLRPGGYTTNLFKEVINGNV